MMGSLRFWVALGVFLSTTPALAVDAVTGASARVFMAGDQSAQVWITGRNFQAGATVLISGGGITIDPARPLAVVPQDQRLDGGSGDGLAYYFQIAADAEPGVRDITVTNPDGSSATGIGLIEIIGEAPPPDMSLPDMAPPERDQGVTPPDAALPPDPPPQGALIDTISRASPSSGARGEHVNLWIVGREFSPGLSVSFSTPGLNNAEINGVPIPLEVIRQAASEDGQADGIQYFMRIDDNAALGPVDITVTNPGGSSGTGSVFEIVEATPDPPPGEGDVTAVSGASPQLVRAGHFVPLWIWGEGFAEGAQVAYSTRDLRIFSEPEVINKPGVSGIRNFLVVDEDAPLGPIDVTVINPNGSQRTARAVFEIVPADTPVGGGEDGPCPDNVTEIDSVDSVQPVQVELGSTFELKIEGRAFACGASIVIPGGGLTSLGPPVLTRDPRDPYQTRLTWTLTIAEDASVGLRDVTVVNPNGSQKTLSPGFKVVGVGMITDGGLDEEGPVSTSFCSAAPDQRGPLPLALLGLLWVFRRRR